MSSPLLGFFAAGLLSLTFAPDLQIPADLSAMIRA
jgi:hypothetical protein